MLRILLLIVSLAISGAAQAQARVGETAPAFDTRLLDGKSLPAAALKGKAVLVVFWATWCPACQKELPELQKLYEKYRSRGFEILALSVDADAFTVEEFWKDHDYGFPVAMRAPQHAKVFGGIRGTPTLFILDRQSALRMAHIGALGLQQLEAKLLPFL
ncbi:MAG: TlpA family protein disulfide reductase [Rhodocyclales bacterium]|nr:TlpA family protein disulfide reductase [Rhodocyclales bacterium]